MLETGLRVCQISGYIRDNTWLVRNGNEVGCVGCEKVEEGWVEG